MFLIAKLHLLLRRILCWSLLFLIWFETFYRFWIGRKPKIDFIIDPWWAFSWRNSLRAVSVFLENFLDKYRHFTLWQELIPILIKFIKDLIKFLWVILLSPLKINASNNLRDECLGFFSIKIPVTVNVMGGPKVIDVDCELARVSSKVFFQSHFWVS